MTAYTRVLAGGARDNVIDIFNVVFGDLQRAATHRGQKRRAGELRDYDQAVAAVHTRMRLLLDALDDQAALAEGCLRASAPTRAGIEASLPGLPGRTIGAGANSPKGKTSSEGKSAPSSSASASSFEPSRHRRRHGVLAS